MPVYLIHFEKPFRHARHYIGFVEHARNLNRRLEHHRAGRGSRLLRAVAQAGISFEIVRIWAEGDRSFERKLKNRKEAPTFCPVCKAVNT